MVDSEPDVAAANVGYRFDAVLVSLLIAIVLVAVAAHLTPVV